MKTTTNRKIQKLYQKKLKNVNNLKTHKEDLLKLQKIKKLTFLKGNSNKTQKKVIFLYGKRVSDISVNKNCFKKYH